MSLSEARKRTNMKYRKKDAVFLQRPFFSVIHL